MSVLAAGQGNWLKNWVWVLVLYEGIVAVGNRRLSAKSGQLLRIEPCFEWKF